MSARILLALSFTLAASISAAVPSPRNAVEDPIVLDRGVDLLQTTGTLHLEVPAGFFAAGSSAYYGNVSVAGAPVGTVGPYEMGRTSLIIQRRTDIVLPYPSTGEVDGIAQIEEFAMHGVQPISVTVGGTTQSWNVSARLAAAPCDRGTCAFERSTPNSGSFTASLPLSILLTFKRNNQLKVLAVGTVTLQSNGGTWALLAGSPTAPLAVTRLPLGLALSGGVSSPLIDFQIAPASPNPNRPGPTFVDPTASVDPAVGTIGRFCSIGANSVVASGAVIGPHAAISNDVSIGANAIVGDFVSIGSGAVIGAGAIIDSHAVIAAGAHVGADSTVGANANIGLDCVVGDDATIGARSVMHSGSTVEHDATVGADVQLGSNATLLAGLELNDGATVDADVVQAFSIARCIRLDGSVELRSMDIASWPADAPMVAIQLASAMPGPATSMASEPEIKGTGPIDPNDPPPDNPGPSQLPTDVGTDIARPSCGGTGHEANKDPTLGDIYICGWYAEQLRAKLASSYSTTFTCMSVLNPEWNWWKGLWYDVPKWVYSHALTDVHWGDGKVTWIEAQLPGGNGIPPPQRLDDDGDGQTEYVEGTTDEPTDGLVRLEVFPSRAAAEAAGKSIPGK